MRAICSLGACCLSAALAYHVVPEANLTAAGSTVDEKHNLTAQGPPTTAQHQQVSQYHGPQPHAVPGAANATAKLSAAPLSANSSGSASLTSPQGYQTSHSPVEGSHPSHQPHQPAIASAPKVTEATSAERAHQARDATNAMAGAEGRLDRAKAAMNKASQVYDDARKEELVAKKAQEAALKAVRVAKDRRAAYYKRAQGESGGVSQPKLKEADEAIRKAERSYAMAGAKWQRVKAETPKKAQVVKDVAAVVKEAEAAKLEAANAAKAVEVAMAEQKRKDEQSQRDFRRLQEKQTQLQTQKAEKVAELKRAHQDRVGKKDRATAKEVESMKARESRLAESVHEIASKVGESREELQAHKPAPSSAA